ncbi:hypothetical protein JCM5350_000953 [Sporobolomyces pararoseus]
MSNSKQQIIDALKHAHDSLGELAKADSECQTALNNLAHEIEISPTLDHSVLRNIPKIIGRPPTLASISPFHFLAPARPVPAPPVPKKGKKLTAQQLPIPPPTKPPSYPISPYCEYLNSVRLDYMRDFGHLSYVEILKTIGEMWLAMDDNDQEPFRQLANSRKTVGKKVSQPTPQPLAENVDYDDMEYDQLESDEPDFSPVATSSKMRVEDM